MKLLIVRVESALKSMLEGLASKIGRSISEVARDIIIVGIEVQKSGGIEIVGPTGLRKLFAKLGFGGEEERLAIWVDENTAEELKREFGQSMRSALREAIHLGAFRLRPEGVEIRGPFGIIRPFASANFPEMSEKAKSALSRLQQG